MRSKIPKFPNFSKLSPLHKERYVKIISNFLPHGDLSHNNLWNWLNLGETVEISMLSGNAVIKFLNPLEEFKYELCVVGDKKADSTIKTLFKYQQKNGMRVGLSMVPDFFVSAIKKPNDISIVLDENNSDYVYDSHRLTYLEGPELRGFRRQINYFLRNYAPDTKIYRHQLDSLESRMILINAMHTWDQVYDLGNNDEGRLEGLSIDSALRNQHFTPYESMVIEGPDGIDGFSIFHFPPNQDWAILSYLKCNYEKRAIFDFVFYCTVSYLKSKGIRWINFEQDLGIEGLRFHKNRLSPSYRLNKYTIRPLDEPDHLPELSGIRDTYDSQLVVDDQH